MSTFLNASPIFGPVRSRRLGLSLGVNMMPASGKICTFDCIYCENGLNAERPCHEPYNTAAVVLDALEAKLREMAAEGELPDVITFAGNGEPTAAPEFPQAIAGAVALRDELAPNSNVMGDFQAKLVVFRQDDLSGAGFSTAEGAPGAAVTTVGAASGYLKAAEVYNAGSLAMRRSGEIIAMLKEGVYL